MEDQAYDESQVESCADILLPGRTVFLGKLVNAWQSCFEDELEVVGDENDTDYYLDNKVDLEPSCALRP